MHIAYTSNPTTRSSRKLFKIMLYGCPLLEALVLQEKSSNKFSQKPVLPFAPE